MDKLTIGPGLAANAAASETRVTLSKMARAASGAALDTTGSAAPAAPGAFGTALRSALDQVSQAQKSSTSLAQRFQLGDPAVSLEETVIASQKASLAFQAALQVRNRVAQAYQEIMQMNV